MNFQLILNNGFILILPLLLWNSVLGSKLTIEKITSDVNSPKWLLLVENISRLVVFTCPLLLTFSFTNIKPFGFTLYLAGLAIYFCTWLPLLFAPYAKWSTSAVGLLAPRVTPLLPFLGISIITSSWFYFAVSAVFILFHTWHGIQNLNGKTMQIQ